MKSKSRQFSPIEDIYSVRRIMSKLVVLVGESRSGKTTSLSVMEDPCYIPKSMKIFAETKHPSQRTVYFNYNGKKKDDSCKFVMKGVDTPGFCEESRDYEAKRSDEELVEEYEHYIRCNISKIDCVLFFLSINNVGAWGRMEEIINKFGFNEVQWGIVVCRSENFGKNEKLSFLGDFSQVKGINKLAKSTGKMLKDHFFFMGTQDFLFETTSDVVKIENTYKNILKMRNKLLRFIKNLKQPKRVCELKLYKNLIEEQRVNIDYVKDWAKRFVKLESIEKLEEMREKYLSFMDCHRLMSSVKASESDIELKKILISTYFYIDGEFVLFENILNHKEYNSERFKKLDFFHVFQMSKEERTLETLIVEKKWRKYLIERMYKELMEKKREFKTSLEMNKKIEKEKNSLEIEKKLEIQRWKREEGKRREEKKALEENHFNMLKEKSKEYRELKQKQVSEIESIKKKNHMMIEEKKSEIEKLENKNKIQRQKLSDLEKKKMESVASLEKEKKLKEEVIKKLREEKILMERKRIKLTEKNDKLEDEKKNLIEIVEKLENESKEKDRLIEQKKADYEKKYEELNTKHEKEKKRITDEFLNEKLILKNDLNELTKKNSILESEKEKNEKEIKELIFNYKCLIKKISSEKKVTEQKLNEKSEIIRRLKEEKDKNEKNYKDQIQEEKTKLEEYIKKYEDLSLKEQEKEQIIKKKNQIIDQQKMELEDEKKESQEKILNFQKTIGELEKKNLELQKKNTKLFEEKQKFEKNSFNSVTEWYNEKNHYEAKKDELEEKLRKANESLNMEKNENKKNKEKIEKLEQKGKNSTNENIILKKVKEEITKIHTKFYPKESTEVDDDESDEEKPIEPEEKKQPFYKVIRFSNTNPCGSTKNKNSILKMVKDLKKLLSKKDYYPLKIMKLKIKIEGLKEFKDLYEKKEKENKDLNNKINDYEEILKKTPINSKLKDYKHRIRKLEKENDSLKKGFNNFLRKTGLKNLIEMCNS